MPRAAHIGPGPQIPGEASTTSMVNRAAWVFWPRAGHMSGSCRRLPPLGCGALGEELADPAHPRGGRVGVVAELLCHPAGAAADAELLDGAANGGGDYASGRGVSDGCSAEENRAWQRTPFLSCWVQVICGAVGISHHPVLVVPRVGLWVAGRGSWP